MIGTENFQDALEPIAIKNFLLGYKEKPMERDMIYTVRKSSKITETFLELGDIGSMSELTEEIEYEDVSQGYKMTISATEFAKGIQIRKKFVLTDQLDIVEGLPKLLGLAGRRRQRIDVFQIFNDAFSTALTTIDALSLCSTAHTSNNGGSTQSNSATTAFSAPQVETIRQAMKAFMTNTDQLFEVSPDMLVVPRGLEEAAYELISSSGKVDTANNNANFHKGKYKMLVSDDLEDSNNFFVVDSELMKIFNVWNNVAPLEFGQSENFDGVSAKYRAYMFYGRGSRDWRWVYGSNVA